MTGAQAVTLSSLERVLWPRTGFTKGDMVNYYERIAPLLLAHIAGRALTLGRFPGGVEGRGFAQTECRGRPEWMRTRSVRLRDGRVRNFCVVSDRSSLLWVANQVAIELHPFLSRERLEQPTHAVFDLDPGPGAGILDCARVALALRQRLADLGLKCFPKTSGFLGLHVTVPLNTPVTFADSKAFVRAVAQRVAAEDPKRITARARRSARQGRVLLDWMANEASRSMIAPYSLRAADFPSVSMPLTWEELESARDPRALLFLAPDAVRRAESLRDPLAPALGLRQRLPSSVGDA